MTRVRTCLKSTSARGVAVVPTLFDKEFARNAFASIAVLFCIIACETSSSGCECDGELDDDGVCLLEDDALADARTAEQGLWESAPWQGAPWLCFDSGIRLRISHSLGYSPTLIQVYLSFANSDDGPSSAFVASGDLARIVEVTDTYVTIENNTEEYFFARLVLR